MKANLRILAALACAAVLVGSAMAQGQGGRRQRGGGQVNLLSILMRSDVQTELKITDDEKTKLEELRTANRPTNAGGPGAGGAGGPGAGTPPDPAAMAARRQQLEKSIEAILTADQLKRAKELLIQREGARALLRKEVQEALSLTEDQKTKIKTLNDNYRKASQEIREKVQSAEMDRQAARDANAANTKTLTDELTKVLTPDQATKLTALGGTPFKFDDSVR